MVLSKDSPIIIVGAGVFGLSNALHLAKNKYKNITVFDRLDFDANSYTLLKGADTASADINKIFRAQYADKKYYQDLAFEALDVWQQWNEDIQNLPQDEAKKYDELKLIDLCGMMKLDDILSFEERTSRANFEKDGLLSLRYNIRDEADMKRARVAGFAPKLKIAMELKKKIPTLEGSLDSTSGVLYASRALIYVKYLCSQMGVKFILGGQKGTFKEYIFDQDETVIKGIKTEDSKEHFASLTAVSCGPWSTSLVPELDGINEGTSGNVLFCKIPDSRKDLKVKYSIKNFPIFGWRTGYSREKEYRGGIFMFPICESEGYLKIIVRQSKYINPVKLNDGRVVSIPLTSNNNPPTTRLPHHIVQQVDDWLKDFFPDLYSAKLQFQSRLLWYTDTIDKNYIYDFVPDKKGLFVACGGSGHAFKMLPVLGQFLIDKIEKKENLYTRLFKWRYPSQKVKVQSPPTNQNYSEQKLATDSDLCFGFQVHSKL